MKKRLKTEAFLAVIFALICQILEMFVFKSGSLAFVMNFLTVIALGLAIMLGVRAATVVEHKREGELLNLYLFLHEKNIPENSDYLENTWKTIIKEELHDESSENSGE